MSVCVSDPYCTQSTQHTESIFSNFEQTHWPPNLDKRALSTSFAIRRAERHTQMDARTRCRERWTRTKVVWRFGMCRSIVCLKHSKMVRMRSGDEDGRHEVTRDWCDGCARSIKFKYGVVAWTDPSTLTLKCEWSGEREREYLKKLLSLCCELVALRNVE